ncbi:MAG: CubicO group peptidase (beta-lactamase class C family) [Reinekea sp.]|jgi:CubicO group peptidase (beta-lactamase class C family)
MNLRKSLACLVLICGLGLTAGAFAVGMDLVPANALVVAQTKVDPTPPLDNDPQAKAMDTVQTDAAPIVRLDTASVEAAWRGWMVDSGVTESSLAIGRASTILHSTGQKRLPDNAYPMASLSKAITGMCLNQILLHSAYSWDSTLADLAPELIKMNFTPAPQMANLTLSQIATHTSGLPKELEYGKMSTRNVNLSSQPTMARAALKEPANFGPRGSYRYSNANYAILGFLIEAMTGEPYADYCKANILTPAAATQAGVTGRMAHAAGYGGWSISVEDYARFAMQWFAPDQPWMKTPAHFAYDETAQYGMGVHVYPANGGTFISHTGRWTHSNSQKPNIGALFFVRADGVTVVANWDGSIEPEHYHQLHNLLRDAL